MRWLAQWFPFFSLRASRASRPQTGAQDGQLAKTKLAPARFDGKRLTARIDYPAWKKTSVTPFVSSGTRFVASEAKATMRPLPLIA